MTISALSLEDFEESPDDDDTPHPEYLRGYADAEVSSQSSIEAERVLALAKLDTALSEMAFTFAEARAAVLMSLKPLLVEISGAVLPVVLQNTFGAHLIETIENEFERRSATPIELCVSPNLVDDLAVLTSDAQLAVVVKADPALTPGQARLIQADQNQMLDLDHLVQSLQSALSGLTIEERNSTNGQ